MKINGGATLWARQTIDSEIFYNKTCFLKYEWIMDKTGATKNQVKHCIEFLKKDKMLATQKATRGFIVKVSKYNDYQTIDNYKKPQEKESKRNTEGTQKEHRSHTINKYDKYDKNVKNKKDINKLISYVGLKPNFVLIINYLNKKTGRNYNAKNKSTLDLLRARFNEGRTVKDFINVIDKKVDDWLTDDKMATYLRPSTLFNRTKFENYLNEPEKDKYDKYLKKE